MSISLEAAGELGTRFAITRGLSIPISLLSLGRTLSKALVVRGS